MLLPDGGEINEFLKIGVIVLREVERCCVNFCDVRNREIFIHLPAEERNQSIFIREKNQKKHFPVRRGN